MADAGGSLMGSIGCGTIWGVMGTSTWAASFSGSSSDMVMGCIFSGGTGGGALLHALRACKCSMAASSSCGAVLAHWIAVAMC